VGKDLADEIDCPPDVDIHDEVKVIEGEGFEVAVDDLYILVSIQTNKLNLTVAS
jgi:hypothetical protein